MTYPMQTRKYNTNDNSALQVVDLSESSLNADAYEKGATITKEAHE